jgi:hypothetical protein
MLKHFTAKTQKIITKICAQKLEIDEYLMEF